MRKAFSYNNLHQIRSKSTDWRAIKHKHILCTKLNICMFYLFDSTISWSTKASFHTLLILLLLDDSPPGSNMLVPQVTFHVQQNCFILVKRNWQILIIPRPWFGFSLWKQMFNYHRSILDIHLLMWNFNVCTHSLHGSVRQNKIKQFWFVKIKQLGVEVSGVAIVRIYVVFFKQYYRYDKSIIVCIVS